ncbi:MAG: PEGA domain-containing protein [Spirochaetales bacterium]|nr:PEGA domain-containing protein [Spirochaetales bacterium]
MSRAKRSSVRAVPFAAPRAGALLLALATLLLAPSALRGDEPPELRVAPGGAQGHARLIVATEPRGAGVRIDGVEAGRTPLVVERLAPGPHALSVSLEGYRAREIVLVAEELTEISVSLRLEALRGWLLVVADPPDALVEVDKDGEPREAGLMELRPGLHHVEVSRFARESRSFRVEIAEDLVTRLEAALPAASFRLSELRSRREAFDPRNAGPLGSAEFSFEVSSFGVATLEILDADGKSVLAAELGPFSRSAQGYRWDGRDETGPLPDGEYRAILAVRPDPSVELADPGDGLTRETMVRVDSSLAWTPGGTGAAGPGLALMAEPFADPPGLVRMALGAALHPDGAAGPDLLASLSFAADAFAVTASASLAAEAGAAWQLGLASVWPLTGRSSPWSLMASARAGGGEGSESGLAWSGDAKASASGGFGAGLAGAYGRKGAWLGAQGELALALGDGVPSWFLALRGGASVGGAAWRLGLSAEQVFDARFGDGRPEAREPRAAVEAHLMPGSSPLVLSVACEAVLGADPAAGPFRVVASLGIAF